MRMTDKGIFLDAKLSFGTSDYDVGMIVTRPGSSGGFVLSESNGRFTFGPMGSPTKQMKSGVQHLLYGGKGVPANRGSLERQRRHSSSLFQSFLDRIF